VLIALQRDGLIERFPRSGTFVAPLDFHFFKQVVEIRIQLESYAAQVAARRIAPSQLNTLRQILKQVDTMKKEGGRNLKTLTQREFEFHDTLIEATHNPKLIEILHELHGISARFWHYLVFGRRELLDQFIDLKKIFTAVENGKADQAGNAMKNHIQNFVEKIRDRIV
jgi:DNA-binding GntR family transcriptional regulator